jgi:hypothetical protein
MRFQPRSKIDYIELLHSVKAGQKGTLEKWL